MKEELTRREILTRIAALGGAVPLTKAMSVLGLMQAADFAYAKKTKDPKTNPKLGRGKKVAIIGAGLSGLTAAYELSQLGFECRIFEADNRAKGRTFTVRPDGSSDSWYQELGRQPEVCNFDEVDGVGSLYFEAGAGRIPSHHRTVLNYCKKFGVKLESFIFASRANLVRSDNFNKGKPVQLRRFKHNLRGYLAEMFRTVDPTLLDAKLTGKEQATLLDELSQSFGDLNEQGVYGDNLSRAGYRPPGPGAGHQSGEYWKPFAFADLLQAKDIWEKQLFNDMRYYWQTSLMQPVGGIDNIAAAFMRQPTPSGKRVGNLISLSRKITSIKLNDKRNKVILQSQHVDQLGNHLAKERETFEADYCISTIAPSLLAKINNDFSSDFKNALNNGVSNVSACKVAWQAERFWESDKYQIYGGISWTSDTISQIWYPSTGFHNQRGILTGAYLRAGDATKFGTHSHNKRVKIAWKQGAKLHEELKPTAKNSKGQPYNNIDKAMTIAWQNMPFQDAGWYDCTAKEHKPYYNTMLKGQKGRFFMAGDAMSYMPGWMEGAITAGLMAKDNIVKKVKA